MSFRWSSAILCTVLVNSLTLAIKLPNTTYLPTDFATDSIKTIIEGLGLIYESYEVVTEDGYIVNLNRMVNPDLKDKADKGVPVLMVNGLTTHADSWFLQADPKLNIPVRWLLEGYDVWLGDQRGSVRSTKHKYLSTKSWEFWDFSFHETGYYDMPAWIDFILQKTGHKKLAYSGLSDGGAFYYVLTTSRPGYQDKLYGGILWSPVGQMPSLWSMKLLPQIAVRLTYSLLHVVWDLAPWPYWLQTGIDKYSPPHQIVRMGLYYGCRSLPRPLSKLLLYSLFADGCQFGDQEQVCLQMATALGGTSAKSIIHTIQLFQDGGKFQQYDYGWIGNLQHYGELSPPVYDISKLKVFTALYYSNWDVFAPNVSVVPFAHKFSGPAYECQIDDVCHVFALMDTRAARFLEDATNVLNEMTGRTAKTPAGREVSQTNQPSNTILKCNVTVRNVQELSQPKESQVPSTPPLAVTADGSTDD